MPALLTRMSTVAERLHDARVRCRDGARVGDVAGDRDDAVAEVAHLRLHRGLGDVDQGDAAAVVDERAHDRAAHRSTGARHQRHLAVQRSCHHVSRMLFLPNRPRERKVTTAMNNRYIDISDHSDA